MDTQKKVTIYSTPTCHFCAMAKDYFKENGVAYDPIDVASDMARRTEMIEKSGQMGVPVIIITDQPKDGSAPKEEIIVGFNKPKLARALGLA